RDDRSISERERKIFKKFPITQRLMRQYIYVTRELLVICFMNPRVMWLNHRIATGHLKRSIPDPELRAKLTPNYMVGCKRVLISNTSNPSLSRPNVEVITERIKEVRQHSIITEDGRERQVDTIIYGTGFLVTEPPFAKIVRGRDGRTLDE